MSKMLTGKEALQALANGECLTRSGWGGDKYIYMDEEGFACDENGDSYHNAMYSELHLEWEIYERLDNKPLLRTLYAGMELTLNARYYSYTLRVGMGYDAIWFSALETFMKLKSHKLSRKIQDGISQWFLDFRQISESIETESFISMSNKIGYISPAFNREKDALKAIKDIGEENIINMFKVFGGVE